jgi:hypothetical protein
MAKLYDRTIKLVTSIASLDYETCPDQGVLEEMIMEARAVLKAIEAV